MDDQVQSEKTPETPVETEQTVGATTLDLGTLPMPPAPPPPQPELPPVQPQQVLVAAGAKATMCVEWPAPDTPNGAELVKIITVSRNTVSLAMALACTIKPDDPLVDQVKVTITMPGKVPKPMTPEDLAANKEPELVNVNVTLYSGTAAQVFQQLKDRTITPQQAITALQRFVGELSELSDLRGIIITCVYGEVGLGGFVILNDLTAVEDADIIMLAQGTNAQAMQFADAMRKTRKITFPGDSPLIIPAHANKFGGRMPPNGIPRRRG